MTDRSAYLKKRDAVVKVVDWCKAIVATAGKDRDFIWPEMREHLGKALMELDVATKEVEAEMRSRK